MISVCMRGTEDWEGSQNQGKWDRKAFSIGKKGFDLD